ncbi:MAG: hypothetical protein RIE08_15345, partial [Acidimicrobiales bacterium]
AHARSIGLHRGSPARLASDTTDSVEPLSRAQGPSPLSHYPPQESEAPANVGELVQRAAEIGGGLEVEAYGDLSPDLTEGLSAVGATRFSFFDGI